MFKNSGLYFEEGVVVELATWLHTR